MKPEAELNYVKEELKNAKEELKNAKEEEEMKSFWMAEVQRWGNEVQKWGNRLYEAGVAEETVLNRKLDSDILNILTELNDIKEKLLDLKDDKKVSISFSKIKQMEYKAVLAEHSLTTKAVTFSVSVSKDIQPFTWDDNKEDANAEQYLKWLNDTVNLPSNVQFYRTSNKQALLSTSAASSIYNFNGTTDVAIADKNYVRTGMIASGIRVAIELKKLINENDVFQAGIKLISASLSSNYPVVFVLTDLRNDWKFLWLDKGSIVISPFDSVGEGVTLLETIVQDVQNVQDGSTQSTIQNTPYRARCSFRDAVLQQEKHYLKNQR